MGNPQPTITDTTSRATAELDRLGIDPWARVHSEAKRIPRLMHPGEYIGGFVSGYQGIDFVFLVATNRRVLFLDDKPLFTNDEEITYDVVSGVSYSHLIFTTVVLHTRIKDYRILTYNDTATKQFVRYLELRTLEHEAAV